ncbi:MAG: aminomethyl-transferring glycine dehydrogenase subunit GcvPB [Planctomycetes bacterium]|nr:aminomethyl-transferring glycine dehydrogenase subunit GcvPB [Planctomycetota bacterium]
MKLIFEQSQPGRSACALPKPDVPEAPLDKLVPAQYLRQSPPGLPEVDELTLVRHYTELSRRNVGVDNVFYPLGSCTMKYNPKINETLAGLSGLNEIHPYQPEETVQGILQIIYELGECLKEISGLDAVSMAPAAGAHGEFTGIKTIKAFHKANHQEQRIQVLIPDSAHGTNPASVAFCGYEPVEIKSDACGNVDLADLKSKLNDRTAAIMLTIPNTLGLFDEHMLKIAEMVHQSGALVYMDGANLNALMGIVKPADLGVDVLHFNLHKTFATPHGGGGPGAGPIAVTTKLAPFLPVPVITREPLKDGKSGDTSVLKKQHLYSLSRQKGDTSSILKMEHFYTFCCPDQSIGRIKGFYGNINVLVKAYIYIRMLGAEGLKKASQMAVLNANYILSQLKEYYPSTCSTQRLCMHECVLSGVKQMKESGVKTLDIAKRLIDYGFHPPTIYFPLIVHEALMIEPTETESKETLDGFIEAMKQIAKESKDNPQLVKSAPQTTVVKRLDEVKAARELVLRYQP